MPRVGNRHFSYTPKGYKEAAVAKLKMRKKNVTQPDGRPALAVPAQDRPGVNPVSVPKPPPRGGEGKDVRPQVSASVKPHKPKTSLSVTGAKEEDPRARFRGLDRKELRSRLGKADESDPKRKALLAVLRNKTLRSQFDKGWKKKAYGDIEGYKPNLAKALKSETDPAKQASLRETLAQVKARRQSFTPGSRFDPKSKTFQPGQKIEGGKAAAKGKKGLRKRRKGIRGSTDV